MAIVTDIFGSPVLDDQGQPVPVKLFNHTTTDYGKWVDYNGMRFKDVYSLRLKDGTVIDRARPNGNSWFPYTDPSVTEEEAKALEAAGKPIPYHELPKTDLISERGTIDDANVSQIRLVPDAEFSWMSYNYTGLARIQHNRRMFSGCLSPEEDLTIGVPKSAKAKFLQIGVWEQIKTKDGSGSTLRMVDYIAIEPWTTTPEFVQDGVSFKFNQDVRLKLNSVSMRGEGVPRVLRLFFQQGGELEIVIPVYTRVTEGDRVGEFTTKPTSVTITKVPKRTTMEDWATWFDQNPIHGNVRFTFYYDDKPPQGAPDDLENPQTTQ